MSKGNVILGYARGSIGDVTLARVKGQQIARARNRNPKNPKSPAQMTQRIKFAPVTKFYQQGKSGLLPFSFANKKPLESDFNAFMRENLTVITPIYPTQEELNNIEMWLPNAYVVANGNLADSGAKARELGVGLTMSLALPADYATTKSWDSFLAKNPSLSYGSIITMVHIVFNCEVSGTSIVPTDLGRSIKIAQFTVGEDIPSNLGALLASEGFAVDMDDTGAHYLGIADLLGNQAKGQVVYHSKVNQGVTEEAFAQIQLNTSAQDVVAELTAPDHLGRALESWGAGEAAILQGSLSGDVR